MQIRVFATKPELGRAAAQQAAASIAEAISARGRARVIAATGASQFEFLEALVATPALDWSRVELFHLDEYVGLPVTHPASFRRYLQERLVSRVKPLAFYALAGDAADLAAVCREASDRIREAPVDVAFVGIGENGHLAFNDPPADFDTDEPYMIVKLDEACRRQQVGEGWFTSIDQVPARAISMSIRQILKSAEIVAAVPDARKAEAVKACLDGPVSPLAPASILQTHANTTIYLDRESSRLLAS
jgi:glucosamine-6-phosphate deaminase